MLCLSYVYTLGKTCVASTHVQINIKLKIVQTTDKVKRRKLFSENALVDSHERSLISDCIRVIDIKLNHCIFVNVRHKVLISHLVNGSYSRKWLKMNAYSKL